MTKANIRPSSLGFLTRRPEIVETSNDSWGFKSSDDYLQLAQLSIGLLQPKSHAHLTAHRGRRRQLVAGLIGLARAPVELPQAMMATATSERISSSTSSVVSKTGGIHTLP